MSWSGKWLSDVLSTPGLVAGELVKRRGGVLPVTRAELLGLLRLTDDLAPCAICGEVSDLMCDVCGRYVCLECGEIRPFGRDQVLCRLCLAAWLDEKGGAKYGGAGGAKKAFTHP